MLSASMAPTTTENHASPDMRLNVLTLPSYYKARLSLNARQAPHNDGVSGPDSRARIGDLTGAINEMMQASRRSRVL